MTISAGTQFRLATVLVASVLCGGLRLHAAPVRFAFQATINTVTGNSSAVSLPFGLAVGQQFSGSYNFASEQDLLNVVRGTYLSVGSLKLNIGGVEISAAVNVGNHFFYLNNPPIPGEYSSLSLAYVSLTNVYPGMPGYVGTVPWSHMLTLKGPDGTISDPAQYRDVVAWNKLTTLRQLELQFGFPESIYVQATIGKFDIFPEHPGDYTANGHIDAADYVAWRRSGGSASGYDAWRAHYGQVALASDTAAVAVPEPSTIVLAVGALTAFSIHRRRRSVPHNCV